MGTLLEDQSMTSETQIMTGLVSQKESWVLRPGEKAHMLGTTVGVLPSCQHKLTAQGCCVKLGGFSDKGVPGILGVSECVRLVRKVQREGLRHPPTLSPEIPTLLKFSTLNGFIRLKTYIRFH